MATSVLVAMSGGVDSSVAAFLLKNAGYDCRGAIMKLCPPDCLPSASFGGDDGIADARRIADLLGISFSVLDETEEFRRHVVDYLIKTYESGATPNPCVECNRAIKFGRFFDAADALGCEKIATGHYAKIERSPSGRWLLSEAGDGTKDQTYVLWTLSQAQLSRTLFPLGSYSKSEIREIARQNGFCNADRQDSQDICFIPDGDYVSFIARKTGVAFPSGDFLDVDGNVIGRHSGMIRYTIGQRKGLGMAFGKPTYVVAKSAAANTVTLGSDSDLFHRDLTAHSVNLIAVDKIPSPIRVLAKIRYKATPAWATVEQTSDSTIRLRFDDPQRAISPGQSVVLYDGPTVIGGGVIE